MTRTELIEVLAAKFPKIPLKDIEGAVKYIVELLIKALENGDRIEIRGFGSFALRYRKPRQARNPKTGSQVKTDGKFAAHFKPGKELRDRVNDSKDKYPIVNGQ